MGITINGSSAAGNIDLGTNGTITDLAVGGLPDGVIDNGCMADDAIAIADLAATGTASATTFLRGDNSWAVPGGGKILQVQSHMTTTQASTTSSSPQDTGSTVNITPSATDSKVLILVSGNVRTDRTGAGDTIGFYRIDKTVGGSTSALKGSYYGANSVTQTTGAWSYMYMDSPSTTSEITYLVKMYVVNTTTIYWSYAGEASTITVMEVGA